MYEKSSMSEILDAIDRRRFPRYVFERDVTIFWAGPEVMGTGHDLSATGMFFSVSPSAELVSSAEIGSRLRLLFKTSETEIPVNVVGRIVRLNADVARNSLAIAVDF